MLETLASRELGCDCKRQAAVLCRGWRRREWKWNRSRCCDGRAAAAGFGHASPEHGHRLRERGRAGVVGVGSREAGAPARQEEPRRRGAQPLREEEEEQDQREDEGAADPHTQLEQDGQGFHA